MSSPSSNNNVELKIKITFKDIFVVKQCGSIIGTKSSGIINNNATNNHYPQTLASGNEECDLYNMKLIITQMKHDFPSILFSGDE